MVFELDIRLDVAGCFRIEKHSIYETCMVFVLVCDVGMYLIKIGGMDAYFSHILLDGLTIVLSVYYQRSIS